MQPIKHSKGRLAPGVKKRMIVKAKYMLFEQGLTQKEAATALGISENTMTKWVTDLGWRIALRKENRANEAAKLKFVDSLSAFLIWVKKWYKKSYPRIEQLYNEFTKIH